MEEEPPNSLDKFKVYYEADITYQEVRKLTKKRAKRNGTG